MNDFISKGDVRVKTFKENKRVIIRTTILVIVLLLVIYGLIKWHEATTFYLA